MPRVYNLCSSRVGSPRCVRTRLDCLSNALPSNVPLRATLCGISSRAEERNERGEERRERTLYEAQEHRPPASRNLRRDCCAPRARRVPEALSLVRGHRKSPEDDQLTEDPLPSNSSCRRPSFRQTLQLVFALPPRRRSVYYDLTIFHRVRRRVKDTQRLRTVR